MTAASGGGPTKMVRALTGGALYGALLFAAGVVFGTARVLFAAPRIGPLGAVLVEIPFMLAVAWLASRFAARRCDIPPGRGARAAMGASAFALLIGAEAALGLLAFGRSFVEQMAAFAAPEGLAGLAGQGLAALFPLLQARRP